MTRDVERLLAEYQAAREQLYRCELALHDAHQTGVDAWITAAADRLHESIERELTAAALVATASRA